MEIIQLKEASQSTLDDINGLLLQLRGDTTGKRGTLAELREIVNDKGIIIIVAKDGKRIIGIGFLYIIVHVGRRTGHVEDVVMDADYRGKGLGESVMRQLIASARENDLETIYLTSKPARVAANKLYRKLGFAVKETNVYKLGLAQ